MVAAGILGEDERLELLDGELVVVSPRGSQHGAAISVIARELQRVYGAERGVRVQMPIVCGDSSLPEPDIAVTTRRDEEHWDRHPSGDEVVLVVEVASSSQGSDRAKSRVYADARVPVYGLLDLVARRLTVHESPSSGAYAAVRHYEDSEQVTPPGSVALLWVASVLPPRTR